MSWPVIASTATTLAVFVPLLSWPGMVGEFMKYLPATVILCLLASLAMALVFLPTLGSVFGARAASAGSGASQAPRPAAGSIAQALSRLLAHPVLTLLFAVLLMALIYTAYARFNHGVEFFPSVEPDTAQVMVRTRGDFSIEEKDAMVRRVEVRLGGMSEVEALYARSFANPNEQLGADVIGVLQFQMIDWHPAPAADRHLRRDAPADRRPARPDPGVPRAADGARRGQAYRAGDRRPDARARRPGGGPAARADGRSWAASATSRTTAAYPGWSGGSSSTARPRPASAPT